ncbi:hypothetical protein ACN5W3_004575 [Vibrio parahaemolyticus]
MIYKNGKKPVVLFEEFVIEWFELISKGQWDMAFSKIDLAPSFGEAFTPETFRNKVENDHFCEGTIFRQAHPDITYSNPKLMPRSGQPEIYEIESSFNYSFLYDVPLNNEFSDLTSGWEFIDVGDSYLVRLDFLHVM